MREQSPKSERLDLLICEFRLHICFVWQCWEKFPLLILCRNESRTLVLLLVVSEESFLLSVWRYQLAGQSSCTTHKQTTHGNPRKGPANERCSRWTGAEDIKLRTCSILCWFLSPLLCRHCEQNNNKKTDQISALKRVFVPGAVIWNWLRQAEVADRCLCPVSLCNKLRRRVFPPKNSTF